MPNYEFKCENCNKVKEIFMFMKDYECIIECPNCKSKEIYRVYGDTNAFVYKSDSEITLGHLGNRHRDTWSPDKKSHLNYEHNKYKKAKKDSGRIKLGRGMSYRNQNK